MITRRTFTLQAATLALFGPALGAARAQAADAPIELGWDQLIPLGQTGYEVMNGFFFLNQEDPAAQTEDEKQSILETLVTRYDGKRVKIPGFAVPLVFDGSAVTEFLLVPYVGACIHVPPPPPNQIVFVSTEAPLALAGLFEAFWVTGTMSTMSLRTGLADVGYRIQADSIERYEFPS